MRKVRHFIHKPRAVSDDARTDVFVHTVRYMCVVRQEPDIRKGQHAVIEYLQVNFFFWLSCGQTLSAALLS